MQTITKKLTANEAIDRLERAIEGNDKKAAMDLIAPDDLDVMPDWDDEPEHIFKRWDVLVDQAMDKYYYEQ